jgi:TatD DNase family protein
VSVTRETVIDSHCHLDYKGNVEEREAAIVRAREAGVSCMITVESKSSVVACEKTVAIARAHDDIFAVIGYHPHDARLLDDAALSALAEMARDPKVVAIGETGLDYHYDNSPREQQRDAFRAFLRLARSLDLPVVVHTREAEEDTLAILREEPLGPAGGVIHCFTGTLPMAEACVELGFHVSFSGIVTFKNAEEIAEAAKRVPLDRLLVETDAPFLAPIPHRGRKNEPAWVVHVAEHVATLRGLSYDEVARATSANTRRLFRLP